MAEADTNALSAAADDDAAIRAVLAGADQIAVPVIVIGEYRYGISQSRYRASYESWLSGLLNDCLVLDINEPTTHFSPQFRDGARGKSKSFRRKRKRPG